jgi:RNA polymerase sigma factor (sigma-70 family)
MGIKTKSNTTVYDEELERTWSACYPGLQAFARRLVYSLHIPVWYGQEDDIAADIVQETARRILERALKTQRGEASPLRSFESMIVVIARNYCKDLVRRDRRLQRFELDPQGQESSKMLEKHQVDLAEVATERAHDEALFEAVAQEVAKFPPKQRNALLTDLANHMFFDTQSTPLQQAFSNVGIQLQEYQQPLNGQVKMSNKQSALLYHAYRRVRHVMCDEAEQAL